MDLSNELQLQTLWQECHLLEGSLTMRLQNKDCKFIIIIIIIIINSIINYYCYYYYVLIHQFLM